MDLLPRVAPDRQMITAYGDGGFRITGTHWTQPVLVLPWRTMPWPAASMAEITVESFQPLFDAEQQADLLLLGCGPSIAALPKGLRQGLRERGYVLEPMNTGAACRTYNVLMMEGRSVAAALLPV